VTEINQSLADAPEKLNQDPHGAAWLVKIHVSAPAEIQDLMSAADYQSLHRGRKVVALSSQVRFRTPPDAGSLRRMASSEELFAHLPEAVRLKRPLDLPPGISEYEIVDYFRRRAAENANGYASFLGAGVYHHYRPVLVDAVVSRGEFLTSYTPYQAEISQGTLTAIFEFQTMICQLTGMDVANASMYDGSTAVPEAALMAVRITGREARAGRALRASRVPRSAAHLRPAPGLPVEEFGYDAERRHRPRRPGAQDRRSQTAAVIVQSPNFFGIVDQVKTAAEIAHGAARC
jgi:glycine dehydrogenase subunit 1